MLLLASCALRRVPVAACAGLSAFPSLARVSVQCRNVACSTIGRAAPSRESREDGHRQEVSIPPLPIRAALVGSGVCLATPLFPVIGFVQLVYRIAPSTATRLTLLGGGAGILSFAAHTLVPNMYYYAPLLFPFALSNAVCSAGTYFVLDALWGRDVRSLASLRVLHMPVMGAVVGGLTGALAPMLYWPVCSSFYDLQVAISAEGMTNFFYNYYILPFSVTTGLIAGCMLHNVLALCILGIRGQSWIISAGPILAGSLGAAVMLYSMSRFDVPILQPSQECIDSKESCYVDTESLWWIIRIDAKTGKAYSAQVAHGTGETVGREPGIVCAVASRKLREALQARMTNAETTQFRDYNTYRSKQNAWFAEVMRGYINPSPVKSPQVATLAQTKHIWTDAVVRLTFSREYDEIPDMARSIVRATSDSCFRSDVSPKNKGIERDLKVCAKKLCRLVCMQDNGYSGSEDVRRALEASGVNVADAQKTLRKLGYKPNQAEVHDATPREFTNWALAALASVLCLMATKTCLQY